MSNKEMNLQIKQTTWDLSPLAAGDDDQALIAKREAIKEASYAFINKWKVREDYLQDPAVLKQVLDEYESWQRNFGTSGDEGYYFDLRSSQEMNNSTIKARSNQIDEFAIKIMNDIQFFELKLAKISQGNQQVFLNDSALVDFRHFLERTFSRAKYQLSSAEESILNLMDAPASANWIKMTAGFLAKSTRDIILPDGTSATKNLSEILSYISNTNKTVRESAAAALNDISEQYGEVAEAEMNSVLADKKINDDLRGWSRPDGNRHLSDDIDTDVVDVLVSSVSSRFDISRRYYELKARLFGVDKLEYYERQVPYGKLEKSYDFSQSAELVNRVLGQLDSEFSSIFERFLANGQLDVFPRQGKEGGAYCIYRNLTQPTYVLLNHTDKLSDVTTLAHEMGHAINNELMKQRQNALNFGNSTATAEVASTFMEDFVINELMSSADDELRLSLMMSKLDSDVSSIFRQVACYKFESALHQTYRAKGYISRAEIGQLFRQHMADYMGEAVRQSSNSENGWIYWPHIRRFFYVYSYASGLLISKSLQRSVKGNPQFIERVKDFMSTGRADSPKSIFQKMGIDITKEQFWLAGLNEVEELLNRTETLAKKLGKV